jgi:anaerobic ribonucleoside-triphosphate reductase
MPNNNSNFTNIRKRNGSLEPFVPQKITNAIAKAGFSTKEFGLDVAEDLTIKTISEALNRFPDGDINVEDIRDIVEDVLLDGNYRNTNKAYVLYREKRDLLRSINNFDCDNPVIDSIWKMTGRYDLPYFSDFGNSDLKPEEARSMCCRLSLDTFVNSDLKQEDTRSMCCRLRLDTRELVN